MDAILLKICAWRCASAHEARVKAEYLSANIEAICGDYALTEALIQSLAGSDTAEG